MCQEKEKFLTFKENWLICEETKIFFLISALPSSEPLKILLN